jgi:hypothetical protein
MSRKTVSATLVKCDQCKRVQLIRPIKDESVDVVLTKELWNLFEGKDLCSDACLSHYFEKDRRKWASTGDWLA